MRTVEPQKQQFLSNTLLFCPLEKHDGPSVLTVGVLFFFFFMVVSVWEFSSEPDRLTFVERDISVVIWSLEFSHVGERCSALP